MRDTRNIIEGGIRDENSFVGLGCSHFNWWDAVGIVLKLMAGCGT